MPPWAAHPGFAPFARWLADAGDEPPDRHVLARFAAEAGVLASGARPLRVIEATGSTTALDFERQAHGEAAVGVRAGSWHDAFNVLAWLAFPRTKAALNRIHVDEGEAATPNRRSRARDAATLLDESGILVACDAPELVELLREHAWHELFVRRAAAIERHWRVAAVGHGLLDRLRTPFRSLTARVLALPFPPGRLPGADAAEIVDCAAAARVAAKDLEPEALLPLPVAALPGWDVEQLGEALFDDLTVFRPKVLRSRR